MGEIIIIGDVFKIDHGLILSTIFSNGRNEELYFQNIPILFLISPLSSSSAYFPDKNQNSNIK